MAMATTTNTQMLSVEVATAVPMLPTAANCVLVESICI